LPEKPPVQAGSLARVLRLEASYARRFWAKFFAATGNSLLFREKRRPTKPINIALSYGYGFLYHAVEWNCLGHGLECSVGLIHKHRKNRPNLACDLVEPLRCAVELTVIRHLDEIGDKARMAARFAEMMEEKFLYRSGNFRLRSIIRLMVESLVSHLSSKSAFHPFRLHARDACL
jgi:CRISPR-associated endonuclease Cas1